MSVARPTYDDTFSLQLLHDYLAQLVCQGYIENFQGENNVDLESAFDTFITQRNRLKEQLFLFAVIDGQYDKLIHMLEKALYEAPDNKRLIDLYSEWTTLFSQLDGKMLTDDLMESALPYRYARMSQAAKCWKFRNDLHTWQEKYGALRPQSDMTEEEVKQAESYRGKCYNHPKDATRHFKFKTAS